VSETAPGPAIADDDVVATRGERRLVVLVLACVLLLGALYFVAVRTEWGQRLDDAALDGRTTRANVLRATDRLLNTISVASLAVVGAGIAVIAVARRRPHLAVMALVVIGGGNLTTQVLKRDLLIRPDLLGHPDPLGGASFPSGHATVAMSIVVALILVVPARMRGPTAAVGFVYAALVGMGVVTAGWHRPSDVIAAYLVAVGWAAGAGVLLIIWRGAASASLGGDRLPVLPPVVVGLGLGLLVVGFLGYAATVVALRQHQLDVVELDEAYAAAMAAIVGVGVLLVSALVFALRNVMLDPMADEEQAGAVAIAT
jgi:membrane-associated phospholipid phosphatase